LFKITKLILTNFVVFLLNQINHMQFRGSSLDDVKGQGDGREVRREVATQVDIIRLCSDPEAQWRELCRLHLFWARLSIKRPCRGSWLG
jgi:hypothetical protein